MNFLITLFFVLVLTVPSAFAAPINCLPKQLGGTATRALVKSTDKGDFVAWYCAREQYPTMIVCLKETCSLAGTKAAVFVFLTKPTTTGLREAMKPYQRDPLRDPELIQVWSPYASEILALTK